MARQRSQLKSPIIDVDDKHNKFFPLFNKKFNPGNCIVDIFPDCFSFHPRFLNVERHIKNLEEIVLKASSDSFSSIVVSDISIKNQVTTSILHIHSFNKPIIKTLHRAINITTAEAELFAICCSINHNIKYIIVITDSLHIARRIFNSFTHLYQIHSAAISSELREFFSKDSQNHIKFWDCPSKQQWALHQIVDKETKIMVSIPMFPCKSS